MLKPSPVPCPTSLGVLNAFAVVAEQDLDPAAILDRLNLDQAGTPGRLHGVIRLVQDIQEHLLQLVRIADQIRQALIEFLHNLHAVIGKVIRAQGDGLAQNVVDLERLALRRALAGKTQQVLHDLLGALRLFQDHLQILAGAARDFRILHEQVGKSHDGRERVVDLMGHAGDKLADGSHFFRVHQLGLDHRSVGDIGHQHHHAADLAAIVAHGTQVHRELALGAIAARDHQLQVVRLQTVRAAVESFRESFLVREQSNAVQPIAAQFVLVKAAPLVNARVGVADQAGSVRNHDHGLRVVQDLAGEVAFALQLRLEVLDLSDVKEDAAVLHDLALAIFYDEGVFQRMDHGAVTTAERDLKVADRALLAQLAGDFVALLSPDIDLALEIELQHFFARLVAQHADQRVIHFNEMAFRRGKEHAFLHVIEQLAVALLGLAAVSDVLKHMNGLQAFIQRAVNTRAGNQICALQHGMQVFVRFAFHAAERTWRSEENTSD